MKRSLWSAAAIGGASLLSVLLWIRLGPIDPTLLDATAHQSLTVVDRNGEVLYEPLAKSGSRAEWLTAEQLPPAVVQATTAAEDQRFFQHPGVDPIAVTRAMTHNVRRLRVMEGGSTISQQVAKLLLGSQRRTLLQKGRETVLALRLEHRLSKRELLALYLNLAPYGNRITGIARASRAYFGVLPRDLTVAQAAFLAALPQRPSAFNPLRDAKRAEARQQYVLARMHDDGFIDARAMKEARAERLRFDRGAAPVVAQHFVERVLAARATTSQLVRTTLDARLQREVHGVIRAQRANLIRHGAHAVAVAVLDNATGEWLAWEGSGDYFSGDFGGAIDGVTALRQPGSTLKPFTYALAFEQGESPATVIADVPSHFPTAVGGVVYTPRNYDGRYRGPLRIRAALAGSENVPAVAMLSKVGVPSLLRLLRNAGFSNLDKTADFYGLGLTLGGAEVTLEQLVGAYAVFARGGARVTPTMFLGDRGAAQQRLVSQRTAFLITDVLSDADAREFIFGRGGSLDFSFPVAVKTGTSQSYRDNWVIGYTRDVTVGVWVGNFDRSELRNSSGVTGAGPIFNGVMMAAMKRARGTLPVGDQTPIVEPSADLENVPVCTVSGTRPSTWCPTVRNEWLPASAPVEFCTWHRQEHTEWPDEYRSWARANGLLHDDRIAVASVVTASASTMPSKPSPSLRVTSPANGATFLIDPTLRMEFQKLPLRAVARTSLTWHIDDREFASVRRDAAAEWPLTPGRHTITAVDAEGRRDTVTIYVK